MCIRDSYDSSCVSYESPIGKSDHLSLILSPKKCHRKFNNVREHVVFDYRESNLRTLLQTAAQTDWQTIIDPADDVNVQWQRLHSTITSIMDSTIPQKTVFLTSKDKYWMTPVTKLLINEKWSAFRSKHWEKYKFLKVKVTEEIKKAKSLWAQKLMTTPNGLCKITKHYPERTAKTSYKI